MKKLITLLFIFFAFTAISQVQLNAPWSKDLKSEDITKLTIEDVSKSAEAYFKTIDIDKKGSGIKPYERWKYHWSFYTNDEGVIISKDKLWKAWKEKNNLNKSQLKKSDESNWASIGPFTHTNTASWSAGQGRVNTVAVDPSNTNTYYIGAPAGGIWKSVDAGQNWSPLVDHLPQIGVSGIAIHPTNSNIIYIATGDDDANDSFAVGVWKSTDGGASWNNTGSIPGNPSSMNEIYINPNSPETVLVATSTGVQKTTDGGVTWVTKLSANIIDLKMKPGDPNTWYAVSSSKFYKSSDLGETFTEVNISDLSGSSRLTMDVTEANPDYVYLVSAGSGSSFNGVYKSTDSGNTFTRTAETNNIFESSQAWFDLAITVSSVNPDIVYVGVLNIWKSENGGDNFSRLNQWNQPNTASYTHADIHFLRFIDGKFFAGTDGGIYVSTNEGLNFTSLTDNLAISQFYKISVAPQTPQNIVGGLQDNGGYAFSDNNWNNYHGADGMDCVVNPLNPNNYYGFIQNGGTLYETRDGGKTRVNSVSAPESGEWVTPLVSDNSGNLYSGFSQLYKLENNSSWTQVSSNDFGGRIDNIEIDNNNNANIYVSQSNGLYRSINSGAAFTQLSFSNGTINGIEVHKNNSNIVWIVTNNGVYKTENMLDSSPTFENISSNLPSESKLTVKHHLKSGKNTIYLGTTLGVYYLNDDSTDWQTFDNNLPNVAIRDLEVNETESKLIAATYGRGVFISDLPRVLPSKDVSIESILNPINNTFTCDNNISPEIKIKNQGADILNSLNIEYTINGGTTQTYNWNGSLNNNEEIIINIPSFQVSLEDISLEVTANLTDDPYLDDNTKSVTFTANKGNSSPTEVITFENSSDVFLTQGSNGFWEIGTPNKTILNSVSSGSNAYVSNLSGNYPNGSTAYLYSNCYDLSSISNPVLKFQMAFDIEEDWDYMTMEFSIDNGASWQVLGSSSDTNWYNSSTTANGLPGAQWSGEGSDSNVNGGVNSDIREYSYDLASFTTESNFIARFKFVSDAAINKEGVVIDDFVIGGVLSVNNVELQSSFAVYPNPSNDVFNFVWDNNASKTKISVFDYTGRLVLEKDNISQNTYQLDLNGFSKGLYFAKLDVDGKQATKKIILK